ncbi:uncharacterized protein LOC126696143 [Quercus robur]|nr:uncharacterized protein LOC115956695 [Quercus lobata]XP_050248884.1 uncharacterized protein LOC126696143 [Quercus robur]
MVSSSIALLQERFRQLEKVKERREEKELLNLFAETERIMPTTHFEPSKLSFQPQMTTPNRSTLRDSPSLELNLQTKQADVQAMKRPTLTDLWPNGAAMASTSRSFENSDVDTSLHL